MSNITQYAISEVLQMAQAVAKSNLFGVKSPDQALALMLLSQAEGIHPMLAARDYHIIDGKPSLKADAMLARFQQAGGRVKWLKMADDCVSGVFSHEQGGDVEISWDMARAKQAQLAGKGNWAKYPRQMLRARVISEGIRATYPGCIVGVYTPEEVQDFDEPRHTPGVVTQALPAPVQAPQLPASVVVVDDTESVTMKDAIAACSTEAALKVVGEQIKKRALATEQSTELRLLFKVQQRKIAAAKALDAETLPESQPAVVTEVE